MLDRHSAANPLDDLEPVTDAAEIAKLVEIVRTVHVSEAVKQYAIDITSATRRSPDLRLGASPRASLHLVRAARAHAALEGARLRHPRRPPDPRRPRARPPTHHQPRRADERSWLRAGRHRAAASDRDPRAVAADGSRVLIGDLPMRAALSTLTTRGRAFLSAGITASLCALILGQRDLLRVGLLLIALPVVTAWLAHRARYLLSCSPRDPARPGRGRTDRHGDACTLREPGPRPDRPDAARGPGAVRPRQPSAIRDRPAAAALARSMTYHGAIGESAAGTRSAP